MGREGSTWYTPLASPHTTLVSPLQVRASQSSGPGSLRSYSSACGLLEAGLQDSLTLQVGDCGVGVGWCV